MPVLSKCTKTAETCDKMALRCRDERTRADRLSKRHHSLEPAISRPFSREPDRLEMLPPIPVSLISQFALLTYSKKYHVLIKELCVCDRSHGDHRWNYIVQWGEHVFAFQERISSKINKNFINSTFWQGNFDPAHFTPMFTVCCKNSSRRLKHQNLKINQLVHVSALKKKTFFAMGHREGSNKDSASQQLDPGRPCGIRRLWKHQNKSFFF